MPRGIDTLSLVLLIGLLALSAFFSSAETAFMSLQRVRLRHLERLGVRGITRVRRLVDQADRTLVTILIGSNLVNTAVASLGTVIVASLVGVEAAVIVTTLLVTVLLLVFGEIVPKTAAIQHSERFAVLFSFPLEVLARVLAPLTALLSWLGSAVAQLLGGPTARSALSEEEIRTVILMGEEAGVLHREETAVLRNVLELEDTLVREVMVPRVEVVAVQAEQSVADVARTIAARGFTSMPVYETNLDDIIGIVHAKDLLVCYASGRVRATAREVMRPALYVPETKTVSSLLGEMRVRNTQMAIVVDEYGGTSGIVTLEDLLEEVVGEITSEYGAERRFIRSLTEREAIVDAAISIDDLNEAFGTDLSTEEADTVGGFIYQQLDRVPRPGDHFRYGNLEFTVISMRGRRIDTVRITKLTA